MWNWFARVARFIGSSAVTSFNSMVEFQSCPLVPPQRCEAPGLSHISRRKKVRAKEVQVETRSRLVDCSICLTWRFPHTPWPCVHTHPERIPWEFKQRTKLAPSPMGMGTRGLSGQCLVQKVRIFQGRVARASGLLLGASSRREWSAPRQEAPACKRKQGLRRHNTPPPVPAQCDTCCSGQQEQILLPLGQMTTCRTGAFVVQMATSKTRFHSE